MTKETKGTPKAQDLIDDLLRVQEENPDKVISRDFYREHGLHCDYHWRNKFGTFVEFRRQAGLGESREEAKFQNQVAMHASMDPIKEFQETQVAPWCGKYEKEHSGKGLKSILIGSDFHDIDADPFVLQVFMDTAKRVQPDFICLAGDIFDLYDFSRFDLDPRQTSMRDRIIFVRECIFRPLREACPNAQIDMIAGNHEHRLIKHLASKSPMTRTLMDLSGVTFSQLLQLDDFKINLICKFDLSVYKPADVLKEVRKNYKVYCNCFTVSHEYNDRFVNAGCSGHSHHPKTVTRVNEVTGNTFWITLGSIAKVDFEYVEGMVSYQNGFLLIHINEETKEIIPEPVIFTENYASVGGQFYRRPEKK